MKTTAALPTRPADGEGVVTADGDWHETHREALRHLIGACGCGYAEDIATDTVAALRRAATPHAQRPAPPVDLTGAKYLELLLGLLTRLGLVEHGGGIGGSWTTPLGDQWVAALTAEGPR